MNEELLSMSATSPTPAIRIDGLSVSFFGKKVLHDQHLSFAQGEVSVLLGRSGSGKTTLLRSINRLNECFDGCRTQGNVRVFLHGKTHDAYGGRITPEELRRRVGMVFQTPNVLPVSIRRNLTMPLRLTLGLRGETAEERMYAALEEAGLLEEVAGRLDNDARTLSGGQQQRLCLARALTLQPEILLLDEPSASLDFQATRRIEERLAALKDRYTLIVVSHSLSQARRLADRLFIFREGRLVQTLSSEQCRDDERFHQAVEAVF